MTGASGSNGSTCEAAARSIVKAALADPRQCLGGGAAGGGGGEEWVVCPDCPDCQLEDQFSSRLSEGDLSKSSIFANEVEPR